MNEYLNGGQWSGGGGAGLFSTDIRNINTSQSLGCRIAILPDFPMRTTPVKPSIIKTKMVYTSRSGITYPICYCTITERYFIKLGCRLWEVKYKRVCKNGCECRKWVQTGEHLPFKGKEGEKR